MISHLQVFKASYQGEIVALKMLINHRHFGSTLKSSFHREMQQLQTLHHPNLVALLGAGEWRDGDENRRSGIGTGRFFLLMELCDRGSLDTVLANAQVDLDLGTALRCASQVAQGMAFLHSKQRIHRDLKSPNILVTGNWLMKVCVGCCCSRL